MAFLKFRNPKLVQLKDQSYVVKTTTTDVEEKTVLLQAFFNSTQQYQVLLNTQLEIVAFNNCACKFHEANSKLFLEKNKSILDYINISLAADFRNQCNKALQGKLVEYEHFINGGWFNFAISALYSFGEIAGLAIVGNNINTQKKNAKIIRQQSECLSNIAWFQSHQVRRPVASILAIMNLIKEEKDYNQIEQYLQMLETTTQQLDEIIRAIVNKSREI